jgi:hypothetical protein
VGKALLLGLGKKRGSRDHKALFQAIGNAARRAVLSRGTVFRKAPLQMLKFSSTV